MSQDDAEALRREHHPLMLNIAPRLLRDYATAETDAVLFIFREEGTQEVTAGFESLDGTLKLLAGFAAVTHETPDGSTIFEGVAADLRARRNFQPGHVPVVVFAGGRVSLTIVDPKAFLAGLTPGEA